ncbi:MAG: hypothetical protein DLM59_04720 [Pseudonocardiales bacterium]|nr:MAG: hypothetical protein DLM59_04720 [Pseudonocardiales bacterium]
MNHNSAGTPIVALLGGQGIAWNYPVGQFVAAFGYPAASPFDGSKLMEASGIAQFAGFSYVSLVNSMTGGSSGGAWLMQYDGSWGLINGHNDFKPKPPGDQTNMYSPHYGDQVATVFGAIQFLP